MTFPLSPNEFYVLHSLSFSHEYLYHRCQLAFTDRFSGGVADWAKGSVGIKYAFGVELRDTGK